MIEQAVDGGQLTQQILRVAHHAGESLILALVAERTVQRQGSARVRVIYGEYQKGQVTGRRKVPGGAAGLQNQSGGRKVPGGFDSLPSPPLTN